MDNAPEKRFRCTACQRTFTRNDHLKRHQLRHTGQKPYQCQFRCGAEFSRSDGLRDHYAECSLRAGREIPATGSGGRRRHACTNCVGMKLRCDGAGPCSSCHRRGVQCSNPANPEPSPPMSETDTPVPVDSSSDRGSIKFLLNHGSEGWVSRMNFPPTKEREAIQDREFCNNLGLFTGPGEINFDSELFETLFTNPFGWMNGSDTMASLTVQSLLDVMPAEGSLAWEPATIWTSAIIQGVARYIPHDNPQRADLLGSLQFLFIPSRIQRAVDLYFSSWNVNAPVLSQKHFNQESVAPTLLASVVIMGALYSTDARETYASRKLADYVELFVYSTENISHEAELARLFAGIEKGKSIEQEHKAFEELLACYIMLAVQFWAGNLTARRRSIDIRMGEIIRVVRKTNLLSCRQLPEDRISEISWIRKESRIRTMTCIFLADCGLNFFQNCPCRLTPLELQCDLPSPESFFTSLHPFSEPGFKFSRTVTINGAFEKLFACEGGIGPFMAIEPNVLDMFIVIHLLYTHVNNQMTLLIPLTRISNIRNIDQDASIKGTRNALATWRAVWEVVRSAIDETTWAGMGLTKHGYSYWLIAQLLMNKKERVESVMRMGFGEDKLAKLRLLLQDDG